MKRLLIAAAVFVIPVLLTSCGLTPQGEALRQSVIDRGAQAYDGGLENAETFMCRAASIGSIKRKYGVSETMAQAYKTLCGAGEDADVIGAPEAPPAPEPPI